MAESVRYQAHRQRLLVELSSLRRHFTALLQNNAITQANEIHDEDRKDSGLGQSDRDAIEAFFHSDDDFTRQFNEGTGNIKRTDLLILDL